MPKKEFLFFSSILILGVFDWLTTIVGILFFGATEANPLMGGLAQSSLLFFSVVKLCAIILSGLAFYKAATMAKIGDYHWTGRLLNGGYSFTSIALATVVASNMLTLMMA